MNEKKGILMSATLCNNLKKARTQLNLSQEYVAKALGIQRNAIGFIESGKRQVSAEELEIFSEIYGVSIETLLHGKDTANNVKVFMRLFEELSDIDQKEVNNLMQFKINVKNSLLTNE